MTNAKLIGTQIAIAQFSVRIVKRWIIQDDDEDDHTSSIKTEMAHDPSSVEVAESKDQEHSTSQ
jgi:hypothetical protein